MFIQAFHTRCEKGRGALLVLMTVALACAMMPGIAVAQAAVNEADDAGSPATFFAIEEDAPALADLDAAQAAVAFESGAVTATAATTYTMTLKYNVNGGTGSFPHQYSSNRYYKFTSAGLMQQSTTADGTYQDTTTKITTETTCQDLINVLGRSGASRKGYHVTNAEYFNTKADGTGVTVRANQSSDSDSNPVTTKRINGGKQITANKTVTLYVNWVPNTYTVTYDANGGTNAPASTTHVYDAAAPLATGKPTRAHYSFDGWQVNGTGSVYAAGQSVKNLTSTKNGTVVMKAKWVEDSKCTVTYDGNGGTLARTNDTAYVGESVTLPDASSILSAKPSEDAGSYRVILDANGGSIGTDRTRTLYSQRTRNYSFGGWNANSLGTGKDYAGGTSLVLQSALTLFARWEPSEVAARLSLPMPERDGFAFEGWALSASALDGEKGSYVPTGDATLYAIWEKLPCSVKFDSNGGVGYMRPESGETGKRLKIPGCSFTRPGYAFRSWNTESDGSGASFAAGDELDLEEDLVLVAQWEALQLSFSVPVRLDYAVRADGSLIAASEEAVEIVSFTDAGIAVTGIKAEPAEGCEIVADPQEPGEVEFSFSPIGLQKFLASSAVGDGFTSVDWRIAARQSLLLGDLEGRVACWSADEGISRSIGTVNWRLGIREIEIAFDGNGAGGSMSRQVTSAGVEFSAPECEYARSDGKRFAFWSTTPDGSGASYASGAPIVFDDDVVLYAIWR